jgi:hypothetical protein
MVKGKTVDCGDMSFLLCLMVVMFIFLFVNKLLALYLIIMMLIINDIASCPAETIACAV